MRKGKRASGWWKNEPAKKIKIYPAAASFWLACQSADRIWAKTVASNQPTAKKSNQRNTLLITSLYDGKRRHTSHPAKEKEQVDGWKKSQVDEQLGQLRKLDGCAFSLLLADESTEPSWLAPASHPPRSPPMKNGRPIKFIPSPSPLRVWDARSKVICFNWIFDWLALHRTRPKWSAKWRVAHNKRPLLCLNEVCRLYCRIITLFLSVPIETTRHTQTHSLATSCDEWWQRLRVSSSVHVRASFSALVLLFYDGPHNIFISLFTDVTYIKSAPNSTPPPQRADLSGVGGLLDSDSDFRFTTRKARLRKTTTTICPHASRWVSSTTTTK